MLHQPHSGHRHSAPWAQISGARCLQSDTITLPPPQLQREYYWVNIALLLIYFHLYSIQIQKRSQFGKSDGYQFNNISGQSLIQLEER